MQVRAWLAVLGAVGALVSGCGADAGPEPAGDNAHGSAHPTSKTSAMSLPSQVMTVEQLAAAVGCESQATMKAADYRQAKCMAAGAEMVLLDFDTVEGQRAWLDYATAYGGVYLVGNRWALSGKSKEYMESLRAKLGGAIEQQGS